MIKKSKYLIFIILTAKVIMCGNRHIGLLHCHSRLLSLCSPHHRSTSDDMITDRWRKELGSSQEKQKAKHIAYFAELHTVLSTVSFHNYNCLLEADIKSKYNSCSLFVGVTLWGWDLFAYFLRSPPLLAALVSILTVRGKWFAISYEFIIDDNYKLSYPKWH